MKHTMLDVYKKQRIPAILFILLSLLIWSIGPVFSISLAHPEKRFYIIVAFLLLWMLKFIFFDTEPKKNKTTTAAYSPEFAKKLQILQGRFQGALDFLKKTVLNKNGTQLSLANLPWHLVIGPTQSGKTTLLTNSNINFVLSKQIKSNDGILPSETCDWWVTRDLVLIDVPSTYFSDKEKPATKNQEATPIINILWNSLLNLISSAQNTNQLNGVIITLNLPELMRKPNAIQKKSLLRDLRKRITDIQGKFGAHIPFHFVITKCDLLPGFLEFFAESSGEELAQTWGLTMPALKPKDKLIDTFSLRFNLLIKRINKQLIWRLHQERNSNVRPYIKDFPLHLERLKETSTALLKTLNIPDLCLQGMYFTSATQTTAEESANYIHSTHNLTHQSLHIMRAPSMPSRAYFIKQFISQGLLQPIHPLNSVLHSNYHWQRRAMYAASIGIIVTAALLLGHDFQQGVQKAYSLQNDLARYEMYIQQGDSGDDRLVKALPLLDALQQATHSISHQLSRIENVLSFYSNRSQQTADTVYSKALQTIIVPEMRHDLEKCLHAASSKNPALVYTALKAYLMLSDEKNRQASFIANTLSKINSTPMNNQALHQLTTHIDAVFSTHSMPIILDQNLIAQVRKQLINLPPIELSFVILKNIDANNADSTLNLGTNSGNPPVFVSKQIANRIPNMFIADNFQKIMNEEINIASGEALKGNWVLGEITPTVNQPTAETLVTQLRNQYIANYVDIWESQLANIQPYSPKNLLQADEMIQNLMNNDSPLLQLLQTVKQNTAFDLVNTASPKIQALDNLVINPNIKESSLYQVFISLRQLHTYLQAILTAPNIGKAAFAQAAERMQNTNQDPITTIHLLAEQNPEPLKSWLNTIANQSWNFILQETGHYVSNIWRIDIMPTYNQHIANRYPFMQNSMKDVNLQQFTHFMGHRGTLANFYLSYLKPFVNDSGEQWTWRVIDNQHIPFSNTLLTNLQRASQIQQAFFPNDNNKLSIEFTLQPIELDSNLRGLALNINGQQAGFQKKGKRLPHAFVWPGNYDSHATTVSFITPKSQLISNTMKGDWGLFRLITASTQSVNSRKALVLHITNKNHFAKYMLFTEGHMNPFLPMNMSRFELPQDILGT